MRRWKRWAIGTTGVLALLAGANLALAAGGSDDPAPVVDVRGPCDEGEHANDPRCAGPQVTEDGPRRGARGDDGLGDISGPCDEAEHANDPRCTGRGLEDGRRGGSSGPSENSGPGSRSGGSGSSGPSASSGPSDDSGSRSDDSGSGSDDSGPGSDDSGSRSGRSGSSEDDDSGSSGHSGPGGG